MVSFIFTLLEGSVAAEELIIRFWVVLAFAFKTKNKWRVTELAFYIGLHKSKIVLT